MNRRNFLFASSGAAAGSLLMPGLAEADEDHKPPYAGSGLVTGADQTGDHYILSCTTNRLQCFTPGLSTTSEIEMVH